MNLQEITGALDKLKDWSLEGSSITKTFDFKSFKGALEFVNKVGEIAERFAHHPSILVNIDKVRLVLTNHASGELTQKDFEVAGEIDKIEEGES